MGRRRQPKAQDSCPLADLGYLMGSAVPLVPRRDGRGPSKGEMPADGTSARDPRASQHLAEYHAALRFLVALSGAISLPHPFSLPADS